MKYWVEIESEGKPNYIVVRSTEDQAKELLGKIWPKYKDSEYLMGEMTERNEMFRTQYINCKGQLRIYSYGYIRWQDDLPLCQRVVDIVEENCERIE